MSRLVSGSFESSAPAPASAPARAQRAFVFVASVAVCGVIFGLGGCSKPDLDDVSYRAISRNITPESPGMSERYVDQDRNMRMSMNQNLRMAASDWGRVWMVDRPSAMSPHRAVGVSGQPR